MKPTIYRTAIFIATILLLTSMTIVTVKPVNPTTQNVFNTFFAKRSLLFSSIPELEIRYHKKFNFFEKLKINQAKRKIAKQLQHANLLAACDTIKLKNGETIIAVVNEIGTNEIKYKKCDNLTGPTYSLKRSDIYMIQYANGSSDFFGNEKPTGEDKINAVNSADAKMDPLAIVAVTAPLAGILLALLLASAWSWAGMAIVVGGIVIGFVSLNRIKKSNGKLKGNSAALTGIILGLVLTGLVLIGLGFAYSNW